MAGSDKALELLLELGDPTIRRARAEHVEHAMRVALTLMDADAVVVRAPHSTHGKRLALHSGSTGAAVLPPPANGSAVLRLLADDYGPLVTPDLTEDPSLADSDGCPGVVAGPVLYIPLRQRDPAIGYIGVYRHRGRAPFVASDARQILLLAGWLTATLEGVRLSTGTERLVVTDGEMDVYNTRFIESALRREARRARRHGQELSVIVIDAAVSMTERRGSQVSPPLVDLASLLAQNVRAFDLLGRHGTHGYLLVLPQTDFDGACVVAARIRASLQQNERTEGAIPARAVNLGVATFPRDGAEPEEVVTAAQRAYRNDLADNRKLRPGVRVRAA
jgi:diguanylate cyclase (GGDEF)-like protein